MALAGTAMDPNLAGLRKRLYGQAGAVDPATSDVPDAAAPAIAKMPSPDFAPTTQPTSTTMGAPAGGAYTSVPGAATVAPAPAQTPLPGPVGPPTPAPWSELPGPPPILGPDATQNAPGATGGAATTASAAAPSGSVEDAVMQNYQQLGATPTGQGTGPTDSAYFIRRINETGGMTPENQSYWFGPNGRIAREMRGEVPPEQGAAETPANVGSMASNSLQPPGTVSPLPPLPGQTDASQLQTMTSSPTEGTTPAVPATPTASATPDATTAATQSWAAAGTNHRPGDGTGVVGVYDWDNMGRPVDAMGHPYMGALQTGEPNPWNSGGADGGGTSGGSDFQSEIRKQLMARLAELGTPVDENSSGIAGAVSGARDEATRASQNERTALAERLYAQGGGGLNSNALTQQIQQSGEKNAASLGGLRANLIMGEYARKQGQLQQTLQLAVQSGDAEAARAAQKAIADLQAQLQREGFAIDISKYQAYLDQNAVLQGLGG